MEPESSLPHSQVAATCPYPKPDRVHARSSHFPKIHLNIPIYTCVFKVVSFPQVSLTKTLYTPLLSTMRATCPALVILLDFITRIIFGE